MKTSLSPAELMQLLNHKSILMIIDVRSREEYEEHHLPFAVNIPLTEIEEGRFIPEEGKTIITLCGKGGGRSEKAADYIRKEFKNQVYFLEGGTFGWKEENILYK